MDKNIEGLIWIKLVRGKSGVDAAVQSSGRRLSLVRIAWTMRSHPGTTKLKRQKNAKSKNYPTVYSAGEQSFNGLRSSPGGVLSALKPLRATFIHRCNTNFEEEVDLCVVCMERAPDLQLLPCRHDRFCRQCIVETICTWVRSEAPSCPLCRGAFHTMVQLA
jgi:hypothetical protein